MLGNAKNVSVWITEPSNLCAHRRGPNPFGILCQTFKPLKENPAPYEFLYSRFNLRNLPAENRPMCLWQLLRHA